MHKQIKYLVTINGLFLFAANMFAPLYAIFVQGVTSNVSHIGSIWATYVFTAGILLYFISKFENNLAYADYFLILGFIFRIVGWTSYIFADTLLELYLIQVILGIGEAFGSPAYGLLFIKYLDRGKHATEIGINASVSLIIGGIGAVIGAKIVASQGFQFLFITMAILSAISVILAIIYRKDLGARDFLKKQTILIKQTKK